MTATVMIEDRDGTRVVILNRPEVMNAINRRLRQELTDAMHAAERDPAVEAVVISGSGRAFCAGQDIAETLTYSMDEVRAWCDGMRDMYQSVRALTKPCVAAWNGIAAGGGMQIGLCGDLRITHAEAKIGQPEVKAGLGSIVGSWMLTHYVGHGANLELSLGGGLVSGQRAMELGLANRLAPAEGLLDAAIAAADELRRVPKVAFRLTKQRFRETTQPGFDAATAAGVTATFEALASGEPQRVMRAFVEERARRKASR
ncbi:MAG: enoyl-CoA hydratase/isomerase family protein [Hyphomicrobiaceae bacterium]